MIRKSFALSGQQSSVNGLVWLTLIVAAVLRLHELTGFSLSNDELSALARLQFDSFKDVIEKGVYPDFHPAGVQVFLFYWTSVFGFSEWIVRIPFALLGIGSVYIIYRIGKMWFGESAGLLAAVSLAVLQYPILYSQIARPYSPGLFFTLLATFFWTKALFNQQETKIIRRDFIGFILSVSACMYIHYFSFIFAGILCFTGLFFLSRKTIWPYLISGFMIVVLYIPHLDIFLHQLSKGGVGGADGWLGPPDRDALSKYINYTFNDSQQLKLLLMVIFAGTILLFRKSFRFTRFHLVSILFFALPFAIAYYYSIYRNPVFQFSVLLFSFPYFLLLIFSFIPNTQKGFTLKILFYSILFGGVYSTVKEQQYYSTAHFSEFRSIASGVKDLEYKYGADQITKVISVFDPYYINYYYEDSNASHKPFELYSLMTDAEIHRFSQIIQESNTPYFLNAFSNVYDDPKFDLMIRSGYPWLVYRDSMLNSGIRLYSKEKENVVLNRTPDSIYNYGFGNGEWINEISFLDSLNRIEGNYSIHIPPSQEFGPTFVKNLALTPILPGSLIEISASFYAPVNISDVKLVLSIEKDGKSLHYNAITLNQTGYFPRTWTREFMVTEITGDLKGDEQLKIYCWNSSKEEVWMDDFKMSIYSPR